MYNVLINQLLNKHGRLLYKHLLNFTSWHTLNIFFIKVGVPWRHHRHFDSAFTLPGSAASSLLSAGWSMGQGEFADPAKRWRIGGKGLVLVSAATSGHF